MIRRLLYAVCILLLIVYTGCSKDTEEVELTLYGLIVPGSIASGENVMVKYVWEGGGSLREIARVDVVVNGNTIVITPYGLNDLGDGPFPQDIFTRTDTASLGVLSDGTYYLQLTGDPYSYYDTFNIPVAAPDTVFQFLVTTVDVETGNIAPNIELDLRIQNDDISLDSILTDTTDSAGYASFEYYNTGLDSVYYMLEEIQTWANIGVPENITLGVTQ